MVKKLIASVIVLLVMTTGTYASNEFSIGLGIGKSLNSASYDSNISDAVTGSMKSIKTSVSSADNSISIFFDTRYFNIMANTVFLTQQLVSDDNLSANVNNGGLNIGISVFGKFPIDMGFATIFPMAGIEYSHNVLATNGAGKDIRGTVGNDYNHLFIKAGFGADFNILENAYLRPIINYNYDILPGYPKSIITGSQSFSTAFTTSGSEDIKNTYKQRIDIILMLGLKI